jgi:hypothetical protein
MIEDGYLATVAHASMFLNSMDDHQIPVSSQERRPL